MEKPPIGVMPSWVFYEKRIKELGEAISRYSNVNPNNLKQVRKWSMELYALTALCEYIGK